MISIISNKLRSNGTNVKHLIKAMGLKKDLSSLDASAIANTSMFYAMDEYSTYIFDEENVTWIKQGEHTDPEVERYSFTNDGLKINSLFGAFDFPSLTINDDGVTLDADKLILNN